MSFDVSADSTQWSNFKLKTDYSAPNCGVSYGTIEVTVPGPGSITNNQFSYTSSTYSFTGEFSDAVSATGTYAFNNYQIVIPLPYPPYVCFYYLTQSGTWTANGPTSSGWEILVSTDFEGDFPSPWTVYDDDGSTNGEYYWGKRDCQAYAGITAAGRWAQVLTGLPCPAAALTRTTLALRWNTARSAWWARQPLTSNSNFG